ncbi:ChaN family lipoprotein [Limnospira fusiformis]|uniref:ChaN family lipoprotein n=1 Tax=Limnospira fusiformis TaxID=54297 RepID=UPI0014499DDB|nr:ChaN family lipoprotein [Limnospira fusiformis SAG 85.79]
MYKKHNILKVQLITRFCTCSLGLFLVFPLLSTMYPSSPALAEFPRAASVSSSDRQKILESLKTANIIYLGETHDNTLDHQAQFEILQILHQHNPQIAIAMEMFQRPYQSVIDQYLAGEISETQLVRDTEYLQRWGFPWKYYAPIVRFARENQLPVLAINTPTEVTRQVAAGGLASLQTEHKRYIPPIEEIKTDNENYRQMLYNVYRQHQHQGSEGGFDRFVEAQVLWDETMADAIANFVQANPDFTVVVIVGKGHVVYNYGIPSRVERRLADANIVQRSVLFQSPHQDSLPTNIADFIWKHDTPQTKTTQRYYS